MTKSAAIFGMLALAVLSLPSAVGGTDFSPAAPVVSKPETVPRREVKFKPVYKSKLKDKYPDAQLIYDSSPKASHGIYEYKGLVFVIVEIDTRQEQVRHVEGTAMLRTTAMLREKHSGLPNRFKAENRLMEKGMDDDGNIYRYATVWRLADIKNLILANQRRTTQTQLDQ